ncbi:MAG: thiamine pyrophosphate-dependent enzyme [Paracoccaceae bacterium]
MRHGGDILIDHLAARGVERVFQVPGESFLAALDGLADSGIGVVTARHEGAAAMMAEADGKMTGRPGIAFATRGPGATNASAGVHVAMQDATPMILFLGQIDRGHRDRGVFQEVDFRAMFAPLAKWAAQVEETARLPEYVARAWDLAQSGRPGPVVLALPEDMLSGQAAVPDAPRTEAPRPVVDVDALRAMTQRLRAATAPLVVLGGPHWSQGAADALGDWAQAHGLPVAVSFRRQDRLDNRHPCYAGDLNIGPNPALSARLAGADVVLALGARLGDVDTHGFTALDPARPGPEVLQVTADADEIGRIWRPAMSTLARADDAALALAGIAGDGRDRGAAAARAEYERWATPVTTPGAVRMEAVVTHLAEALPEDAILTNGAGNYASWLHRYYPWRRFGTQLAPTCGSMGYGLPAAIAASLRHPGRDVVALAGDGCFQMTGMELATALQHGATPVVIVCDNGQYGTIRMHQERQYPGRPSGTALINPDFAALARACGAWGQTVTDGTAFPDALAQARACGRVALIHLRLDSAALTPGTRAAGL